MLWLVLPKWLVPHIAKIHGFDEKELSRLPWLVGIIERFVCTGALLVGGSHGWQIIGAWIAMKVAARWQKPKADLQLKDSDNLWLIGTTISLLFGILGAWIALGRIPT